ELPTGWAGELGGGRPVELFCLSGEGALPGEAFRESCYAYVPGSRTARLEAREPVVALAMVEDERPDDEEAFRVVETSMRPYEERTTGVGPGLAIKHLR